MNQKNLAKWLKIIIICIAVSGAVIYIWILPFWGRDMVGQDIALRMRYWPWLIFLWLTAIPCYSVLTITWKIAIEIGQDHSFSMLNAKYIKRISQISLGTVGLFFVGNLILMFMGMSHLGILLLSLIIDVIGIAIAIGSSVLSHLVFKAAELKEQNDLTI